MKFTSCQQFIYFMALHWPDFNYINNNYLKLKNLFFDIPLNLAIFGLFYSQNQKDGLTKRNVKNSKLFEDTPARSFCCLMQQV